MSTQGAGRQSPHAGEADERYRMLFESIDEGFCVIEKVSDAPIDFRYLETNPAFAVHTGVADVIGKSIREAFPGEPEQWFEIYDSVVRSGEPIRFGRPLVTHGRVLELYAFRVNDATDRRVGVIPARRHDEQGREREQSKFQNVERHVVGSSTNVS